MKTKLISKLFCNIKTQTLVNDATQSVSSSKTIQTKSKLSTNLNFYKNILDKTNPEDVFPRGFTTTSEFSAYMNKSHISPNLKIGSSIQIDSINKSVFIPAWDLLARGGKGWRPLLGLIIANFFKIDIDPVNNTSPNKTLLFNLLHLVELLHNASLIIDDVEDKSQMRRNKPCVHLIYGEDIGINAGISLLYFPMYRVIKTISDEKLRSKISETYLEEMAAIHLGQAWDIEMKLNNRLPGMDDYVDTVICKTGVMPRLMVKLIKALANDPSLDTCFSKFVDIIDSLSVAFQIRDDVLNIIDSVLAKGKGFLGEDIYEGKLTLMVLHTLNCGNSTDKDRLTEIIKMKTKDQNLLNEAIQILEKNGSIDYANNVQNSHVDIVKSKLDEIKSSGLTEKINPQAADDLMDLTNYLINRNI